MKLEEDRSDSDRFFDVETLGQGLSDEVKNKNKINLTIVDKNTKEKVFNDIFYLNPDNINIFLNDLSACFYHIGYNSEIHKLSLNYNFYFDKEKIKEIINDAIMRSDAMKYNI